MSSSILSAYTAGLMVISLAGPAFAEPPVTVATGQVKINDLDLNSPQGAHQLLQRVSATAATLCAQTDTPVLPKAAYEIWRCRARTIATTITGLNSPLVAAEYALRFGAPPTLIVSR